MINFDFVNINERYAQTIRIAQSFAIEYRNDVLGPSHILMALMHKDSGVISLLNILKIDISYIREWAEVRVSELPKSNMNALENLPYDKALIQVFEESEKIRLRFGLDLIDTPCLLIALVKPACGYTADQLKSLPLSESQLVQTYMSTTGKSLALHTEDTHSSISKGSSSGVLYTYCTDKNEYVKKGNADPVVGRDMELATMVEILNRRSKPNVLLIGDPGVGKSALIDGFVAKIVDGEVPLLLKSSIVFELNIGSLLAGASYKGEVEDRMKKIINDLKQYDKAILFIDEIHMLADPKGIAGSGLANLLKPELARGELTIIGATTQEEYRKYIEPDAAFSRRFETLTVQEPDVFTAAKMIQSVVPKYESHHGLRVEYPVIKESVRLAKRYIKERRLPDAAIDLLDRTMAAVRMMKETSLKEIIQIEMELQHIEDVQKEEQVQELRWLHNTLLKKISPVLSGQLAHTEDVLKLDLPQDIYNEILSVIQKLKEVLKEDKTTVTAQDIAAVVACKTGIPLGKIQSQERDKLLNIEQHLQKRVIGQDHALKVLSDTIIESRSGIQKQGQPIGSFFFLGPTGTGKTELTKAIAEFLFNDEKAMIRFDMSEFKEEHSAALLYGAPPGYVGYEEGGMLVNKIRQKPYSVVLFDEIEKAHHSVFDTFLQIMDEGSLHDKLGKEGDFSNSIIIFTSNIASEWVAEQFRLGIRPSSQRLMEIMTKNFRPEFLARVSEIIPFAPIAEENIVHILEIQLRSLFENLSKQGVELHIDDTAKRNLALSGFTQAFGARQLATTIRTRLRRPIARMLVSGELTIGDALYISMSEANDLEWNIQHIGAEATINDMIQNEIVKL